MMTELEHIPHHIQLSLNVSGLVSKHHQNHSRLARRDEKTEWIKLQTKNYKNIGLFHMQETHFESITEARAALLKLGGKIIGLGMIHRY